MMIAIARLYSTPLFTFMSVFKNNEKIKIFIY